MEDLIAEGVDDSVEDFARVKGARVVHRRQDPRELEVGVEPALHLGDRVREELHSA